MTRLRGYLATLVLSAGLTVGPVSLPLSPLAPLFAQQADTAEAEEDTGDDTGGLLVRLLENTLSSDSRTIRVTGLDGAFSSRATIAGIEVSDADGVWLRLTDAVLDWNRLALVRGRFSVNALTAGSIDILRPPLPSDEVDLPSPEAQPFAMPELPVSIEIGELSVGQLALGADLLGFAATLAVEGRLTLADGALDTDLRIDRTDRVGDRIALLASFANDTRQIGLDLNATEDAGGLISAALGLPGAPALTLTAKGSGPVTDFAADIQLATDGQDRVTGRVELAEAAGQAIAFTAGLDGDLRPLMDPEFRSFFGPASRLRLAGQHETSGVLDVSLIALEAEALTLTGDLALSPKARPTRVNLDLSVGQPGGDPVILPVSGADTRLRQLTARAGFDAAQAPDWTLSVDVDGFSQPDLTLGTGRIEATGTYQPGTATPLRGQVSAALRQLGFADPGLRDALGPALTLDAGLELARGGQLTLSDVELTGRDLRAGIEATVSGLRSGFQVDGRAEAQLQDLSRFAALAGQPLGGQMTASLTGRGAPLGGTFDFALDGRGQDLRIGQDKVDPLLTGQTDLRLEASRGPGGLTIRQLSLQGEALTLQATGTARTGAVDLDLTAGLDDLGRILPDIPGPVTVRGTAGQTRGAWQGDLDVTAPGGAVARVQANVPAGGGDGLSFDLSVTEPAGGPIGALLQMPDRPALALQVTGSGAVTDLSTQIALASDGQDRITGQVDLTQPPGDEPLTLAARLGGDLTPFLPPQFHDFFGRAAALDLTGLRHADGRMELPALTLTTAELQLDGSAALDAQGRPLQANLTGQIAPAPGEDRVQLPVPGAPVTVQRAQIALTLDSETAQGWSLSVVTEGLTHPQASLTRLTLRGDGAVRLDDQHSSGQTNSGQNTSGLIASGRLRGGLLGLAMADPALRSAIGSAVTLDGQFDLPGDDSLTLTGLTLTGTDIAARADATLSDLGGKQALTGQLDLSLGDLARFSGLARRPLGGAASARLAGSGALSPRQFDMVLTGVLQDVTTGIGPADQLLAGRHDLRIDAASRGDGADLRSLTLTGPALQVRASGFASPTDPDLTAQITLDDLSRILPPLPGETTLSAALTQQDGALLAQLDLDAPNDSFAQTRARVVRDGPITVDFDGRMNQLERFMPQFPGALTAKGTAERENGQWQLQAEATGPAGIDTIITGRLDEADGTVDATAKGSLQLAAANGFLSPISVKGQGAFDLALRGKPALDALSGQITVSQTSIAVPQAQTTIRDFGGAVTLNAGSANVDLTGALRSGGGFSVRGPVQLAAPFDGNLSIALQEMILTDEVVFRSPVSGQLSLTGPLASTPSLSGRVDIGDSEIDIGNIGGASVAAPIPPLTHVGEPGDARATRARAGLIDTGTPRQSRFDMGLDVLISAPRKIFVRGRGLDAELGGEIYLRGSTANIVPAGQIELIRGIMALFGRRLELSKGLITLQGSLRPYLEFAATSSTNSGTATLEMAGQVNDLQITITSDPDLPEEEALAMLLFGNEFANLSPFKLAQIAAGLLTLRGGGSDVVGQTGREATGADSVSVASDSGGLPSLGVGGYLSDNVYTDVTVNTDGNTELNINLDVTDNLTLKGTVDGTGDSAIGIFFDRDY